MTIVLSDTIAIDGKVIETIKSVGLTPKIPAIPIRPLLDPISKTRAEIITGFNGWIKVKHLPIGSSKWYSEGNILATSTIVKNNTTLLNTEEWTIPWNNMNQVLVVKGDFEQWLMVDISKLDQERGWRGMFNISPMTAIATNWGTTSFSYNGDYGGQNYSPIIWSKVVSNSNSSADTGYNNSVDCLYAEINSSGNNHYGGNISTVEYSVWVRNSTNILTTIQPQTISLDYKYFTFLNRTANQTSYNINFSENTECDILIVGGGGCGGNNVGGGGGAGAFIINQGLILNGNHTVYVGSGGVSTNKNGSQSYISNTSGIILRADGGGQGGILNNNGVSTSGCTGGGGGGTSTLTPQSDIPNTNNNIVNTNKQNLILSSKGGNGFARIDPNNPNQINAGGGGGVGGFMTSSTATASSAGIGNDGIYQATVGGITYNFGDYGIGVLDGGNYYIGGGGGGGGFQHSPFINLNGGRGGGGVGRDSTSISPSGGNGINNTGSGGGGGSANGGIGGNGGSGIVIIRYKTNVRFIPINEDYKYFSLTYNDIPDVVYNFTPYNDLQSWISYANSFGATTNVTEFDTTGVWVPNIPAGHITYSLPNSYNYIDVIFGNPVSTGNVNLYIDNVLKMSTTGIQTKIYTDTYTNGQILKIDETNNAAIGKNLIIKLSRRQSQYTVNFPENTECDILVVAGGGGGGRRAGGGGGAGALLYHKGQILNGIYDIKVGNGGSGIDYHEDFAVNIPGRANNDLSGYNGHNSEFIKRDGSKKYLAIGGAGGHGANFAVNNTGGSSGGTNYSQNSNRTSLLTTNNFFNNSVVAIVNGNTYNNTGLVFPEGCRGNLGGDQVENVKGGGGGGAGGVGQNHGVETTPNDGYGGDGLGIDITGNIILYAGGGNGSVYNDTTLSRVFDPNKPTIESRGGGGFGSDNGVPENGKDGTGGGGGGQGIDTYTISGNGSGNGGSGIVIIKYKIIKEPYNAQWTYSSTNPSVYYLGNVGIGTTNPTSALSVVGSVYASIGISALSKSFKIEHPLNMNKWLYHGCVEAPRFDNIYRGKKMVTNGCCYVDIDSECNKTGGMTAGTFIALNTNSQLYLRNNQTFDGVKGKIVDGKIIINCQNIIDEIEVDWLVIGERKDENVINVPLTSIKGNLICEHNID